MLSFAPDLRLHLAVSSRPFGRRKDSLVKSSVATTDKSFTPDKINPVCWHVHKLRSVTNIVFCVLFVLYFCFYLRVLVISDPR